MSTTPSLTSPSTPSPRSIPSTILPPRKDPSAVSQNFQPSKEGPEPSTTKPTSPKVQTSQATLKPHHHIPHHPHRPHRHREPVKTVQAALLQSTAFGEILSPVKSTARGFAARGNREERHNKGDKKELERDEDGPGSASEGWEPRVIREATWADVTRQKKRRMECQKKLREQLTSLSNLATSTTRQLDYTYYSLLSSLPSITNSLSLLSDLAVRSQTLLDEFTGSSIPSLTADVSSQIASLRENFDNLQSERISALEARMMAARARVIGLGERVESVKTRVEEWEQRETEGKRRGKRRVSILCGVLGSLLGLFLIMVVFNRWQGESDELEGRANVEASRRVDAIFGDEIHTDAAARLLGDGRPPDGTRSSLPQESSAQDEFDARLRVFDEL
ncbi:hypothetical protein MMC26_000206 [Xylographa opegraphella]|nr:hypothetical protein [Xylographa opegraphella]